MEFYDVINARHMVREWKSEDISMEALKRILAAGLKAPTHDHRRNWEFIILHGQQEKEAALQFAKAWSVSQEEQKEVSALGSIPQRMYAYAMPRQYSMLVTAPYVVIPLFKGAGIWGARAVNGLNSFASIWCVVENILLAATAEGLACSMRIPVGEEGKQVMSVLDVPEGYVMPCYIGIGYPAENAPVVAQVEKPVGPMSILWTKKVEILC